MVHEAGAIIIIVLACGIPGWLILTQFFGEKRPFPGDWLAAIFTALTAGVLTLGWVAFILAESGRFSLFTLGLIWLVLTSTLAWRTAHTKQWRPIFKADFPPAAMPRLANWLTWPVLGGWLIASSWLFFRPHIFVTGAADAGVYVNLSAHIAREGRILVQDEVLATLEPDSYTAFLRTQDNPAAPFYLYPAFFVDGEPRGEIVPQFYHLHPVWQSVAYALGGTRAALLLTGLWGMLGVMAVYLVARELAGWETAVLAMLALSLNAMQIWFARYPTTEALTQYLLWAGFWSLAKWQKQQEATIGWALLAGVTLGELFLVRIDMVFALPALGLFLIWLWGSGNWGRAEWAFTLPLAGLIGHSLVHAWWQSRPYFVDLFGFGLRLTRNNPALVGTLGIVGVSMLWLIARHRNNIHQLERWQIPARGGLILAVLAFGVYGWFIRPFLAPPKVWNDPFSTQAIPIVNHENLLRLGWYLSPVGVWLGIVGICWLVWRARRETAVLLGITLTFSAIYLWNVRANPQQIYAMRRYVPATLPLFILSSAVLTGTLLRTRTWWRTGLAVLLAIVWLGGILWSARGFISQVDYPNILPQLDDLQAHFPDNAVILFNDPAPIGQGDILGTPLRFLYGRSVLTLRDHQAISPNQLQSLIQHWQESGKDVFWIQVPNAPEIDTGLVLTPAGNYQIETTILERTFDHKPAAIDIRRWQGSIYHISPP